MNEPKNHLRFSKQALNYLFQQDIIFKTYLVYGFLLKMSPLDPAHHPMLSLFPQSCLTLCNPMDYSPSGSSIHGVLQARILEWVAITFSRGSSQPKDQTPVSCIASRFFTIWATRETPISSKFHEYSINFLTQVSINRALEENKI